MLLRKFYLGAFFITRKQDLKSLEWGKKTKGFKTYLYFGGIPNPLKVFKEELESIGY